MAQARTIIETLPVWAELNEVGFYDVKIERTSISRGNGIVCQHKVETYEETFDLPTLISVPHDLILCPSAVEEYAREDSSFKELLDAVGRESGRRTVLLFMIAQLVRNKPNGAAPPGPRNPWTDYIKMLPRDILVPTLWTDHERTVLEGTTLEPAVASKLVSLVNEYDLVQRKVADVPSWAGAFHVDGDNGTASIRDWVLVDAWYRSRSLDLPKSGVALVPCIDMANHAANPTAYFDENDRGEVVLLLEPKCSVSPGEEITISYGDKSPGEMLFSYGFVDPVSVKESIVLRLEPFEDDPLARAKQQAFGKPETVTINIVNGRVEWDSPWAYLVCLNEEDGLEFRLLQEPGGPQKLVTFWEETDVTNATDTFEQLVTDHDQMAVFELRVTVAILELVRKHHDGIVASSLDTPPMGLPDWIYSTGLMLKDLERDILEKAMHSLEADAAALFQDESVVAHLGSMEVAQNAQAANEVANDSEDDFA